MSIWTSETVNFQLKNELKVDLEETWLQNESQMPAVRREHKGKKSAERKGGIPISSSSIPKSLQSDKQLPRKWVKLDLELDATSCDNKNKLHSLVFKLIIQHLTNSEPALGSKWGGGKRAWVDWFEVYF